MANRINMGARILVVDDHKPTQQLTKLALEALQYEVDTADDGFEAVAKAKLGIDLLILDLEMPGMDGFEVIRTLRNTPDLSYIPVIMVTGSDITDIDEQAQEVGVNGYLQKPVDVTKLQERAKELLTDAEQRHVTISNATNVDDLFGKQNEELRLSLEETVAAQREAYQAQVETIHRLALAAETKDNETGMHVHRVSLYTELLGKLLSLCPKDIEIIRIASPLHDVGKIGIPDRILLKPNRLDDYERKIMQTHTEIGARILENSNSILLETGKTIALTHHERWDGKGYPNQLYGENIPLVGRICAIVDVFDALASKRPYKEAFAKEKIYEIMMSERGAHFDPAILDVFFEQFEQFVNIQIKHCDESFSSN